MASPPVGSNRSLSTGDAFDVKVQSTVEKRSRLGYDHWRSEMRYVVSNALPKAVTVSVLQAGLWGDTAIKDESQKSTRRSAEEAEWLVTAPANATLTLPPTFQPPL